MKMSTEKKFAFFIIAGHIAGCNNMLNRAGKPSARRMSARLSLKYGKNKGLIATVLTVSPRKRS